MRGGTLIFTALFSKIILKKRLYRYHYAGIILMIIGLGVVGLANFLFGVNTASGEPME